MKRITSLLSSIFRKKSKLGESYLAIFLMQNEGVVHVLQKSGTTLQSIQSERFTYTNGWEHIVEDVDDVLYRIETGLGDVPDKAIFFVFSHFVEVKTREIRKPVLAKIKELVKSLDLEALGYIEAREAAVEHMLRKKRTPPTMMLLELDSSVASLFIYHNGQVSNHKQIEGVSGIAGSVADTLASIKSHTSIPQELVIYTHSDNDTEPLAAFQNDWGEGVFESKPTVEILSTDTLERGLIELFSGQIAGAQAPAVVHPDEDTMGFVIGDDVEDTTIETAQPAANATYTADKDYEYENEAKRPNPFAAVLSRLKSIRLPKSVPSQALLAGIGLLLIVVSLGALEYFYHKATVVITLPAQNIEKALTLTDDDIALRQATRSAQLTERKKATGTKTIGEKAKGAVTIYNSSLSGGKSFGAGTEINGPGGLAFLLDDAVSVASAEGDASSIQASTKDVSVTASAIGSEYNVSAGNKFTVEGESENEVIAKNGAALSGGTKETITIVSAADIESLKKTLTEKAKKLQTSDDGTAEQGVAVPQLSGVTLENTKSSPALSEEADTVELAATGKISSYYYDSDELNTVILSKLKPDIREGLVLKPSDVSQSVRSASRTKTKTSVVLAVKARATPVVDLSRVKPALTLKRTAAAEEVLKQQFKARSADIAVTHPIGFLSGWLPVRGDNIAVDIRFEDQ